MVLALSLPASFEHRDLLIDLTFGVVLVSILAQGLSMASVLRWAGAIGGGAQHEAYMKLRGRLSVTRSVLRSLDASLSRGELHQATYDHLRAEHAGRESALEEALNTLGLPADEVQAIETPEYSTPYLDGILAYVKGSALVAKGQMAEAEAKLETIRALAASPEVAKNQAGASPTAEILALAAHGLVGEIAYAKGDYLAAADAFEQGVAVEDTNNYTEPPDWPQSMRLYQGAALLKAGDYEKAEAVFRRDLLWHQNNGWSLYGLMRALEAQGKADAASQIRKQWEPIWANADVELSAPVFL